MAKRKSNLNQSSKRKNTTNKKSRNGFIFIFSIIFIIIGACFFYRERISGFYNKYFKVPQFISNLVTRDNPPEDSSISTSDSTETSERPENTSQTPPAEEPEQVIEPESQQEETDEQEYLHTMTATLYFIKIEDDSNLSLIPTKRNIHFNTKPLTKTMAELLKGPTNDEQQLNIHSTIPENTTLLWVKIKQNVAYLNFSGDFEYNGLGKESTISQLKQIVYTVTEFKNIKAVQFLIEGKQKKYLGGEGILIHYPLSRNDFT